MGFYWAITASVLIVEWLGIHLTNFTKIRFFKRIGIVIACMILVAITGLRYGIGTDYFAYQDIYYETLLSKRIGSEEIGIRVVALVSAFFSNSNNPELFFILCSCIFFGFTFYAIDKMSPNIILSTFLLIAAGFFFFYMNIMRQMLAASILLASLNFAAKKKTIPFLLLVALATSFHWSAIVFVVVWFIPYFSNRILKLVGLVLIILSLSGYLTNIMIYVGNYSGRYERYINSSYSNGNLAIISVLVYSATTLFSYLANKEKSKENGLYRTLLASLFISCLIASLSGSLTLADRLCRYFSMPLIILLPTALSLLRSKHMRFLFTMSIATLFIIYAQINFGLLGSAGVVPYQSIF